MLQDAAHFIQAGEKCQSALIHCLTTRSNICANELGAAFEMRYKSNIGSIEHRFYEKTVLPKNGYIKFDGSVEEL